MRARRRSLAKSRSAKVNSAPLYLVAIDPSSNRSGIAWHPATTPHDLHYGVPGRLERIDRYQPLIDLAASGARLRVIIEKPGHLDARSAPVMTSVRMWRQLLIDLFPRRYKMETVLPQKWQKSLLAHVPDNWVEFPHERINKRKSLWYAHKVLKIDVGMDDDLADALCLLAYLRLKWKGAA